MVEEIKSISLASMSNGAHFNFMQTVINRVEANATVKAKVEPEWTDLKSKLGTENLNLKVSTKSSLTELIVQWDNRRDNSFLGYRAAVKSYLRMPDGDMLNAAKALWQHIIDYKIDTRMQLDRQTGMLTNFITDLEETFSEQVSMLGLDGFVRNLKEANEQVRQLIMERDTESASRKIGAMKAARRATDEAYLWLVKKINAYAIVEGPADYQTFISEMNAQIKRYKQEVLGQNASSGKPSEETPTPPDEGTDLPFEPVEPNPDEGGSEEPETPDTV